MSARPLRIGYVLNRFPRLSQTFVLNEILELERQGVEIEVFSLLPPPLEGRQPALGDLKARVTYLPGPEAVAALPVAQGLEGRAATLGALVPEEEAADVLFAGADAQQAVRLQVAAATLAALARLRGIAHLHAHFGTDQTAAALLAARLAGVGFSWTAHARDLFLEFGGPSADRAMRRAKVAEARFVVAVSEYNRALLAGLAPAHAARIHHLPNGIDFAGVAPAEGAPPGEILAVGRLVEKKGFADLVDACARLTSGGADFRCRIIGDGPLRPALAARIRDLGLRHRVLLEGEAPHPAVFAAMRSAGLFTLPCVVAGNGDRDGLPTVLIEAMGYGLPTVSCPVTGVPEIVEDGVTGVLVPSRDPVALADALGGMIADPAKAGAMGRAGRARAQRLFDLRTNVARLRALFQSAVTEGAASRAA